MASLSARMDTLEGEAKSSPSPQTSLAEVTPEDAETLRQLLYKFEEIDRWIADLQVNTVSVSS